VGCRIAEVTAVSKMCFYLCSRAFGHLRCESYWNIQSVQEHTFKSSFKTTLSFNILISVFYTDREMSVLVLNIILSFNANLLNSIGYVFSHKSDKFSGA